MWNVAVYGDTGLVSRIAKQWSAVIDNWHRINPCLAEP